jgi:hypothetical protein
VYSKNLLKQSIIYFFINFLKLKVMNTTKVKVVADATTGSVINLSVNNPEYGYVRLEQKRSIVDDNGFLRVKPVSTLLHGTVNELKAAGFFAGQELTGQIVIQERLTPFNEKSPEKDLKIAGSTGIVCTLEGQPIYRRTLYTAVSNAADTLIKHDNVEQLRNAYAAQSGKSSAITNARPAADLSIGE